MNIQGQKTFIIRFAYCIIIAGILFAVVKYALPLLMPFVIGLVIAFLLKPLIDKIASSTHLNRKMVAVVLLLTFYAVVVLLLFLLGGKLLFYSESLLRGLPSFYSLSIEPTLNYILAELEAIVPQLHPAVAASLDSISQSLSSLISSISTKAIGSVTSFASSLPSLLVKLIFTILASFFFTLDYKRILSFVMRQFSPSTRNLVYNIKDNGIVTILKLLKAYALLLSITFIELTIGFTIMQFDHAALIAVGIALLDILPILGTGSILIPWVIIELIKGEMGLAIGLLVLYVLITVVRYMLEPRIVGKQVGVHPLIILMCMFVGAQLFGFIGLLGLPISAAIIKNLNDNKTIHLFR